MLYTIKISADRFLNSESGDSLTWAATLPRDEYRGPPQTANEKVMSTPTSNPVAPATCEATRDAQVTMPATKSPPNPVSVKAWVRGRFVTCEAVPSCCFLCAFAEGEAAFPFGVLSWTVDGDDFDEQAETAALRILGVPACLCLQRGNCLCFFCTCGPMCSGNYEHHFGELSVMQWGIRSLFSPCLGKGSRIKNECVPLLYSSSIDKLAHPFEACFPYEN